MRGMKQAASVEEYRRRLIAGTPRLSTSWALRALVSDVVGQKLARSGSILVQIHDAEQSEEGAEERYGEGTSHGVTNMPIARRVMP